MPRDVVGAGDPRPPVVPQRVVVHCVERLPDGEVLRHPVDRNALEHQAGREVLAGRTFLRRQVAFDPLPADAAGQSQPLEGVGVLRVERGGVDRAFLVQRAVEDLHRRGGRRPGAGERQVHVVDARGVDVLGRVAVVEAGLELVAAANELRQVVPASW